MKNCLEKYFIILVVFLFDIIFHGIGQITPKIDLLLILFITLRYNSTSLTVLFLLGILHDTLYVLPLGLSSISYLLINFYAKYCTKELLSIKVLTRIQFRTGLIVIIMIINYLLLSIYQMSLIPFNVVITQFSLTLICWFVLAQNKKQRA